MKKLTNSPVTIREAFTKKQIDAFIDLPYRLYRQHPCYVPQLKKDVRDSFDKKKNPSLEFCESRYWLAYQNKKLVGRIAGIINHASIEKWGQKYLRFGWFDFENDENISGLLLQQVETWAIEKGMSAAHGPMGFTNFDYAGMLTEGYDQLGTFASIYNFPYYPALLEKAGYCKEVDWVEYKIKIPTRVPIKLEKIAAIVQQRYHLQVVRAINKEDIRPYARDIFKLLNSAYADLFGMSPLNEKQIEYNTKKYLSFIRPDFVSLVLDHSGELVAFGITMPSLSKALQKANGKLFPFGFLFISKAFRKNKLADLCLVAVRKDLQGKGVNALLMHELTKTYIQNGIEFAESNPELEDNTRVQSLWEYYEKVQHKRRRCYIKYL